MKKNKKPKKFFIKKEFIAMILPLFIIGLIVIIKWNDIWQWINTDFGYYLKLAVFLFIEPIEYGEYGRFALYLVLLVLALLIIKMLYNALSYSFSLWWKRDVLRPPITYQQGDLDWCDWKDKQKYLNRCLFNEVNADGLGVDIKNELTLTLFGHMFLLRETNTFKENKNTTKSVSSKANDEHKKILNQYVEKKESIFKKLLEKIKIKHPFHFVVNLWKFNIFKLEYDKYIYQYDFATSPGNVLINGPTRSGKTQSIIKPVIDLYSRINNFAIRPSMVVGDPKGELVTEMGPILEARGYDVWCINLKDETFINTHCYNPLRRVYDKYYEYFQKIEPFIDMEAIHNADNPLAEYWQQIEEGPNADKIKASGYTFQPAIKLLDGLSQLFIPDDEGKDPYWPQNAQGWMNSLLYYMLETSVLSATPEKFSLKSLVAYLSGSENFIATEDKKTKKVTSDFHQALENLPLTHYSRVQLPQQATVQQHGTFKNNVCKALAIFSGGAGKITSLNNIDMEELVEGKNPIALFLTIPDAETTYNIVVNTMIEQIYQLAAATADDNKSKKLNRGLRFLLDEFANIPKIKDIGAKVSVCLGRNISFTFIIQNKEQMDEVYGDNITQTILNNSLCRTFIGGNTKESCEYFSEQIGQTTRQKYRIDIEQGIKKSTGVEVHFEEVREPLISSEDLFYRLEMGDCFHIIKGLPGPIKGQLLPAFKYMGKYDKMSLEEFYANKHKPHTQIADNDLIFKDLLHPFKVEEKQEMIA